MPRARLPRMSLGLFYSLNFRLAMNDLLTAADAADELDVTARTVRRWISDGEIEAQKVAGIWLIRRQELDDAENHERERVPA